MATPSLKRRLFGYSQKSVRGALADRDIALILASKDVRDSEQKITSLERELERARGEAMESEARNRDLASQLKESTERFRAVERSSSPSTTEGLTEVLHAAERALARLTDTARRNAEQELGETERAREQLRAEVERLAAWRDLMTPLASAVRRTIEEAQVATSALAGRVAELAESPPPPTAPPDPEPGAIIRLDEPGLEVRDVDAVILEEPLQGPWGADRPARSNAG